MVLNARDAQARGAQILTRTQCTGLRREADHWQAMLCDSRDGRTYTIRARAIVNATGPWVEQTRGFDDRVDSDGSIRLIKGSHIVVPKLFEHRFSYIFQHADNRVIFAIPYENDFTLLGTTDIEISGDPDHVRIDDAEVAYICDAVNQYFQTRVSPEDVIWSYSGVRPLFDDQSKNASRVTRDYVLQIDDDGPPILSVFGGKITTYRKLSEQAVDRLKKPLGFDACHWTAGATLPGGEIPDKNFEQFLVRCKQTYPWLEDSLLTDYARNYGSDIKQLLLDCDQMKDLGQHFGGNLFEAEVDYLMTHEWAETSADVLWRRTKKGLHAPAGTENKLQQWMNAYQTRSGQIRRLKALDL